MNFERREGGRDRFLLNLCRREGLFCFSLGLGLVFSDLGRWCFQFSWVSSLILCRFGLPLVFFSLLG